MDIWYDKAVGTSYNRLLSHNGNSEKLQPSVMYMLVTTSSTAICKWDFCKKIWNCYKPVKSLRRMGCCLHPFRAVYHCWRRRILWYYNLFLNFKNVISSHPLKLIQLHSWYRESNHKSTRLPSMPGRSTIHQFRVRKNRLYLTWHHSAVISHGLDWHPFLPSFKRQRLGLCLKFSTDLATMKIHCLSIGPTLFRWSGKKCKTSNLLFFFENF